MSSNIKILDFKIKEEELEQGAIKVLAEIRPNWDLSNVTFKIFTDGITNKLIGCSMTGNEGDVVLVRVYGVLQEAGYAPNLYATFKNGLAYEYLPGVTLNVETVKDPDVYCLVAKMIAGFHSVAIKKTATPVLWDKIQTYLSLIPDLYNSNEKQLEYLNLFPNGKSDLEKEAYELKAQLNKTTCNIVFCHNDLLLSNIIHDGKSVSFIDYEYAGYNYQAYDIGNHFAEFAGVTQIDYSRFPDRDFQISWLNIYLKEFKMLTNNSDVKDNEVEILYEEVNKFVLASHLTWTTWALVQAQHSTIDFNFFEFAIMRLNEYKRMKNILF